MLLDVLLRNNVQQYSSSNLSCCGTCMVVAYYHQRGAAAACWVWKSCPEAGGKQREISPFALPLMYLMGNSYPLSGMLVNSVCGYAKNKKRSKQER